jgi:hypothetical protein
VYQPPRCVSVSLFLKTDTTVYPGERFWRLDTIVTGLSPTESTYTWTVPETTLSWAKVLAIAYGPGWQYDESDSAFRILPGAVSEAGAATVWQWHPPTVLRNSILVPGPSSGQATPALTVHDALGRRVAELRPGPNDLRHLAPGVYFVRRTSADERGTSSVTRVVLAE